MAILAFGRILNRDLGEKTYLYKMSEAFSAADLMKLCINCIFIIMRSCNIYILRLNTDVDLCQSLRKLLADKEVMASLDPDTRCVL